MLSEMLQSQKDRHHTTPLAWGNGGRQLQGRAASEGRQGGGQGTGSDCSVGAEPQFCKRKGRWRRTVALAVQLPGALSAAHLDA